MDFDSIVETKTRDEIVEDVRRHLRDEDSPVTNWNPGGIIRTLTEMFAQGLADLYSSLTQIVKQGFVVHATGRWLDLHCEGLGITRFEARRTRGVVIFGREDGDGSVTIPAGTIVRTDASAVGQELRFFVDEPVVLPDGELEVAVPVRAEFEGAAYNVGTGAIRRLATHIAGIDYVTNRDGWIIVEGTNRESDDALRRRYLERWDDLAQGATKAGYAAWARSVAGVVDVAVDDRFPRGQGTVDVIITGPAGTPSQALIDEVQAYLETQKPITDNVLVRAPAPVVIDVDVCLYLPALEGDLEAAKRRAATLIEAMFISNGTPGVLPWKIGETPYRAKIASVLMGIEDVVNVAVDLPAEDVPLAPGELATLGTVTIRAERVGG